MIVITGGAGFIGSVLAWKFNETGENGLLIVDQKAEGAIKWQNLRKRRYSAYLEYDEFIQRLERGDYNGKIKAIFHMGACSDTTETDADFLMKNNTEYSRRVASWCLLHDVYCAYASSAAVYGDGSKSFSDDDKLTPSLEPLNLYGKSKLDFDKWVLHNGYEQKLTGFRFFNVYGPNEYHKGAMRSLAQKGYEQVMATGKLRLFKSYRPEYPDGGQKRDFIYVKDVVDALFWFYRHPSKKGIFNLGTGRAQSWNELANAIFKACRRTPDIEYIPMPDSIKNQYQYFTEADLKKFRSTGCPAAFLNVEHGVADYAHNYLSAKDPCI